MTSSKDEKFYNIISNLAFMIAVACSRDSLIANLISFVIGIAIGALLTSGMH